MTEQFEQSRKFIETLLVQRGYRMHAPPIAEGSVYAKKGDKARMLVVWLSEIAMNTIPTIVYRMNQEKVNIAVVIVKYKITPMALTSIRLLATQTDKKIIETFKFEDTLYNILEHALVPHHKICTKTEKQNILESYAVTKSQLPSICASESVCKILGAKKGNLIRIERPHDTMANEMSITYRIVV
jgi:DNA-directed RNA polymerase subunit H (RpoH/RPB5)